MKNITVLILVLIAPILSFAQVWQVLPNSPLIETVVNGYRNHDDIAFCDENTGWICDIGGRIFKTEDGGDSWTAVASQPGTSFRSLAFTSCDIGFARQLRTWRLGKLYK
ncbi:MAG: hypothetical protein HRT71_14515 [Flavobacteriales bacterium]|nr:hypothetical protein [Flavobacteriales bacterium]